MLLQITDGSTTLTLSGDGVYLGATYFPRSEVDGTEVTESAVCVLEGTEAAIRGGTQAIELLLGAAARQATSLGPRVYVQFRPTDTGETYRSEIVAGVLTWSEEPNRRQLGGTLNTVELLVTWTRRPYWEGAEVELYLVSSSQTERQGGVAVYNNDNAGATNWFQVAANRVVGALAAPVRVRMTNASGASLNTRTFYLCNNVLSAPANADVWLLGSESVYGATRSWTGAIDHDSLLFLFPLPSTLLAQTQGRPFRVMAACTSLPTSVYMRCAAGAYKTPPTLFVATRTGREQAAVSELLDLGTFPIPPGGLYAGTASAALALTARAAASGSITIDFVMLMATDSFRRLRQVWFSLLAGEAIEDNGIDGTAYLVSADGRETVVEAAGDPLMVFPGRVNRMHMLFEEDGQFVAGRQMTVQAWYRPRFATV